METGTNFSYDGMNRMNRINEYIKSVGEIQQEQWKFFYGPTGIDKVTRTQGGMQNLAIDYTTDKNGRILSAAYNETGGFTGNYFSIYDNYGNISYLADDSGNSAKAILIDPNNGAIDPRYDPNNIDDPFTYRAASGFIGIELWDDGGTAYLQGYPVMPNPWGSVSINKTTTTYTTDIIDKSAGDRYAMCCSLWVWTSRYYQQYKHWDDQIYNWTHYFYYEEADFDHDFNIIIARRVTFEYLSKYAFIMWLIGKGSLGDVVDVYLNTLDYLKSKYNEAKRNHKENCEAFCSNCQLYFSVMGYPSGCDCGVRY